MWGKRADSSDVGLADFASFYCILVLIKKLWVYHHPSPLSSLSLPRWSEPLARSAEGVSGPTHPNPAPSKAPPGRRPPPRPLPLPFAPTQPPLLRASGLKNNSGSAASSALCHCPGRGRDSDPPPSVPRGAAGSNSPGTREASRGQLSAHPASPHLSALGATRVLLPLRPPGECCPRQQH
ncbi:E3 ubiquitin-protein ligase MARCH11 isoform X2 [Rhinolophus ferrumequinum]|uniref:E3 ubiquitin-protein ligase MARCH11 isoform X2 n=1 Tax=Rhinolophus ferrumequinum TaxID=59479 RepID=UPI00140FBEFF|nr:E3 ubiquitin-protein ligase MARCH11 isoform X2 [Rhinolophus ferrumequinum]